MKFFTNKSDTAFCLVIASSCYENEKTKLQWTRREFFFDGKKIFSRQLFFLGSLKMKIDSCRGGWWNELERLKNFEYLEQEELWRYERRGNCCLLLIWRIIRYFSVLINYSTINLLRNLSMEISMRFYFVLNN